MKMRPEALIFGYGQMLQGWTVMDRLSEIQAPTLVLAGRHDFMFPPEHQAILADRLPRAQLVLVEKAGHNPQMERSKEVIEVVKHFMITINSGLLQQIPDTGPTVGPKQAGASLARLSQK
jgi:proline iminopeptidase